MIRKIFGLALFAAVIAVPSAIAQSVESIPFRVNMSTANEVPAIENFNASGFGTVWVHVMRDAAGKVLSGTVDFGVRYQFPGDVTFTGLHIHRGNAGSNGPVVIGTTISGGNPVVDATGRGEILRPVEVAAGSANVAVLEDLLQNPAGFYINLHSTVYPGGVLRAQLTRAERRVYGAMLTPDNEVPAVNSQARGIGFATFLTSFNASGEVISGEVTFDLNYSGFTPGLVFTGMHFHNGFAGTNGPVTINTGLAAAQNITTGASGAGSMKYVVDVNVATPAAGNTILGIWKDPGSAYWNLHTTTNPGGEIRAQLRGTEAISFTSQMSTANEVPAIVGLDASAGASFGMHLLRRPDGGALAAYSVFNVNHRFPGETTFTGLHIHNGPAGANGPVTIDSGIRAGATVLSATGAGNIYRTAIMATDAQLAGLNQVLMNPDNNYINLHTMDNPGGAVRSQIARLNTAAPTVEIVISAISDVNQRRLAPGGLMTIFGANLSELGGNLDGWQAGRLPSSLNGTSVDVGGKAAAILHVDPRFILAQVPVDAALGETDLVVKNSNGTSSNFRVTVARVAPGVFFDQISSDGNRAVAYNVSDGLQVTKENPAPAGMMVGVFGTGFGISNPPQETGQVVRGPMERFANVTVTVGGREAREALTSLIPGYVGFSQTIFTIPAGLSGPQVLEIEYMGVRSNRTILYLR